MNDGKSKITHFKSRSSRGYIVIMIKYEIQKNDRQLKNDKEMVGKDIYQRNKMVKLTQKRD